MKIDKTHFLLLTTTLAGSTLAIAATQAACNVTTAETTTRGDASANRTEPTDDRDGSSGAATDAGGDAAGTCLGTEGSAPVCEPAADAGADAGTNRCIFECSELSARFKPAVARELNNCLNRRVPTPQEEGSSACTDAITPCITETVAKACDDGSAAAFCTTLLAGCDDAGGAAPTATQCVNVVKALSAEGRTTLQSCVAEAGDSCASCLGLATD